MEPPVKPSADEPAQSQPPLAERRPHTLVAHGESRIDEYYWLRDDERKNADVLAYLNAENTYTQELLAPQAELQEQLYSELIGRIPVSYTHLTLPTKRIV